MTNVVEYEAAVVNTFFQGVVDIGVVRTVGTGLLYVGVGIYLVDSVLRIFLVNLTSCDFRRVGENCVT